MRVKFSLLQAKKADLNNVIDYLIENYFSAKAHKEREREWRMRSSSISVIIATLLVTIIVALLSSTTTVVVVDAKQQHSNNNNRGIRLKINDGDDIVSPPPANPAFQMDRAYAHLMYSYSSYCDNDVVSNWTCPYCINQYIPHLDVTQLLIHDRTNTFGFIGISQNNTIVIAFRGTEGPNLANWITNLNIAKLAPYPGFPSAMVHAGFLDAYGHVQDQVETGITAALEKCPQCDKFIATGHSLGGALAVLAVADVYPRLINLPIEMYTFGSPRVGNVGFVEYFESVVLQSYWRLVNYHDVVPHLPSKWMNFYHLPVEVWFNNSADPLEYKMCNGSGEDPTCSDSLLVALNIPNHLDYLQIEKALC
ncbi:hypothetical protein DFA_01838 [Cavenderia fasciculata]|uniref:Fungal lipase-type domain-containing protein n=1 Tax=Cavenderia fasciculata TaxID=261658 RepID=F4PUZ0_CACFS|nr:uncharacterized protein DFA_01838 [Cavenderia fasciculata]EGG21952.1 hypothetical protein DFA_01838 [Cavenderia fasciculata]|eukprot:XP_004359803.1 hypothetical protein DFA_01838 [Cavenderia fasciculata]